jgi:protein ImuB
VTRIGCLWLPGVTPAPAASPAAASGAGRDLIEVALAHSPLVEDGGPGLVYLEVAGLRRLFGDEADLGRRLARSAAERGLAARVGIAGSRVAALAAALRGDGVTVIAPGEDAAWLAPAPLGLLGVPGDLLARLHRWGLTTCGELCALPARGLFERLGSPGLELQRRARGEGERPLRRCVPPPRFEESVELEWAADTAEPLRALMAALAERLAARLARRGLAADRLEWRCRLAGGAVVSDGLTPATPLAAAAEMLPLLHAALEARPPGGAVAALALAAHPVRIPPAQASLTEALRPSPRLAGEVMARLAALVGAERVGVPVLLDTHRPDALALGPFSSEGPPRRPGRAGRASGHDPAALALRRQRPRRPAAVTLVGGRPVHLRAGALEARIVQSAGPWRASGDWWTDPWRRDEWDVELGDGTLCRLAHDGSAWFLDGIYD